MEICHSSSARVRGAVTTLNARTASTPSAGWQKGTTYMSCAMACTSPWVHRPSSCSTVRDGIAVVPVSLATDLASKCTLWP